MKTISRKDFEKMTYEKKLVLPLFLNSYYSPYNVIGLVTLSLFFLKFQSFQAEFPPLIWIGLGLIAIAVIGIWRRDQRRNFKTIPIALQRKRFKFILSKIAQDLKWDLERITQDYIIAYSTCPNYGWKRRVTILRTKEAVLVNMICLPKYRPFFGTGGIERNYGEILEKNIRSISEQNMSDLFEKLNK